MLKEGWTYTMDFVPYTIRQFYSKYEKRWKPMLFHIQANEKGKWWIIYITDDGDEESNWDYEEGTIAGTNKCNPDEVKDMERSFICGCNVPAKKVSNLHDFGDPKDYIGRK